MCIAGIGYQGRTIDELIEARVEAVALLCYEADVAQCRRSALLEALTALRPALAVDAF